MIEPYKELHQEGIISIHKDGKEEMIHADIGIQISHDGRIWLCIDGKAFVRFRPMSKEHYKKITK